MRTMDVCFNPPKETCHEYEVEGCHPWSRVIQNHLRLVCAIALQRLNRTTTNRMMMTAARDLFIACFGPSLAQPATNRFYFRRRLKSEVVETNQLTVIQYG